MAKLHQSYIAIILFIISNGISICSANAEESDNGFEFDENEVETSQDLSDSAEIVFDDNHDDANIEDDDLDDDTDDNIKVRETNLSNRFKTWDNNHSDTIHSSSKFYQYTNEATSSSYVITSDDIRRHGFRNLSEILRHISDIETQTGESQFQVISARGLLGPSNNRTRLLWFLNDMPLNDAHHGQIFIDETFPIDLIRRIEINVGPQGALYGPGAFLGTIHIYTKEPSDIDKYGEYRITMQNNLTFKGSASAAYQSENKKFGFLGHVSGGTTQGAGLVADSVYRTYLMEQAEASIIHNNPPDSIRRSQLDNNGQKNWYHLFMNMHYGDFNLHLGYSDIYAYADGSEITPFMKYGNLQFFSENQFSNSSSGEVISSAVPTDSYHFNRRYAHTNLNYQHIFDANVILNARASYHLIQYRHENYHGLSSADNIALSSIDFDTLEHHVNFTTDVMAKLGSSNYLSGGISLRYQYADSDDLGVISNGSFVSKDKSILIPAVWIRDEQYLWDERIVMNAGVRYDAWQALDKIQHDISWQAGFLGKFHRKFGTRVNYSYAVNEPTFYELSALNIVQSNAQAKLDKESIHQVDLDFLITPIDALSFTLGGYYSNISNLIEFKHQHQEGGQSIYVPGNESDANIYGGKFEFSAEITQSWKLYGYYNFLYSQRKPHHSEESSVITDKRFKDDSMHRAKFGFSYTNEYVTADLAAFLVAGIPETVSEYNIYREASFWRSKYKIPPYFIIQPAVSVKLPANLGLSINGSYAFSEDMTQSPTYRYYYEKEGLPVNRYSFLFSLIYPYQKQDFSD